MNWTRSLYWRIALGVVGFLAVMLVVQAVLFVWVVAQSGRTLPGQSPVRFAQMIALDVSNALLNEPDIDLEHYLNEQYSHYTHPFFVVFADGRLISVGSATPDDTIVQATRRLLERRTAAPVMRARARGRGHEDAARAIGAASLDDPELALSPMRPMPIVVNGRMAGMVVVPDRVPFTFCSAALPRCLASSQAWCWSWAPR